MNQIVVESFTMDHTKVEAPFVRKCGRIETPKGDSISKFDLRFTQPNKEAMPTYAIHALEHLMAGYIREEIDNVVDLSPMGCRTGFYLIAVGDLEEKYVGKALVNSLEKVLDSDAVPADNEVQCGNYRDLSLEEAKKYAEYIIDELKRKYI